MTSVPTDPLIGQTLDGRYAIRSRIARGGMAMVYLANDLRLERRVAVKVMHEHLADDENFRRRFEREARSAAGLSHPNLVNVFDQGHDLGRAYLVMEYLPSITLRDLLKKQLRLTAEETMEISDAVLSGLAAAHQAGIVHRDLKPENVLLADDGRIKLGDFGLARAVSANTTTGQALLGTIAYLSPELVTRGVADARSDLYAFGIMLYEMLTGTQPFVGEQPMQIAYQHAHSDVPMPSLKSEEASPELDELVRWTTQRDPELRPTDAGEALTYLTALRQGVTPPGGATRVLQLDDGNQRTPSTTVLDGAQRDALAMQPHPGETQHQPSSTEPQFSAQPTPVTPIDRAAAAARRRGRRGRLAALIVVLLVCIAGGTGYWFGNGPGSQSSVPDVAGLDLAAAKSLLEQHSLLVDVQECPSLDVDPGFMVSSEPKPGTRVDRGSTVRVCQSTGPQSLPVPTIAGLSLADAKQTIADAHFTFGEVREQRFSDQAKDVVLAAVDAQGDMLGETLAEQAQINLIVSAGQLPAVAGLSQDAAATAITKAGLVADQASNSEVYSDDVAAGKVIGLITTTDPVRPGDAVGLQVSLGPELFEVPNVVGKTAREAIDELQRAGFVPQIPVTPLLGREIPESDWDEAEVVSTNPKAGTKVRAGTEISIRAAT